MPVPGNRGNLDHRRFSDAHLRRLPDSRREGLAAKFGIMPRGSKAAYTDKQKRKAAHIEDGYRQRGVSEKEAEARAWATVNKQDGGGQKRKAAEKK